ncbi:hypothetical protein EUTSA_v100122260mg, partial [Eutrema salsugineum]
MEGSSSSSSSPSLMSKADGELEEMLDRMASWRLEAPVSKLPPLTISSLSSQSPAVLEILSHVNKRVKHQHEIGLPLLDLWKLYTDPAASPMVRNFVSEDIAPKTLENVSKLPQQHQEIVLRFVIKV